MNTKFNISYNQIIFNSNTLILKNKFFYVKYLSKLYYFLVNSYFINSNFYFIFPKKKLLIDYFFKFFSIKFFKTFLFLFCGFSYAKIFLKVGLGFRKKYSLHTNLYNLFVGRRKWVTFKLEPSSFFFNIRRRNIFMFCNYKSSLYENIVRIKYMRKETVYKVKGIMSLNRIIFNRKISRSIIFARRVKFRKMKLKLTKKQKQRK